MKKAVNNNRPGNMETMYEHRKNGLMGKIISYDDRAATLIIRLNDGKSKIMAWSTFRSDWRIAKAVETPVEEVKPVENKLVPMPGADLDPVEGRERGREQSIGDMKKKMVKTTYEIAAKANLKGAYNVTVGGCENSVSDGEWTQEEFNEWIQAKALDDVLYEAMHSECGDGYIINKAPSCMKKVSKSFCVEFLLTLFEADGYHIENVEVKPAQSGHPAPNRNAQLQFDGRAQNICAWAKELGISANTLYGRIYKMGWSIEKAFTTPTKKNN